LLARLLLFHAQEVMLMSAEIERLKGLEVEEDLRHHQRQWRVERIGWLVMATILAAAGAGLLGGGPLSEATVGAEGSTWRIEYDRFERYHSPAELRFHVDGAMAAEGAIGLRLGHDFLRAATDIQFEPSPRSEEVVPDGALWVFAASDATPGRTAVITVSYEADDFGPLSIRASVESRSLETTVDADGAVERGARLVEPLTTGDISNLEGGLPGPRATPQGGLSRPGATLHGALSGNSEASRRSGSRAPSAVQFTQFIYP